MRLVNPPDTEKSSKKEKNYNHDIRSVKNNEQVLGWAAAAGCPPET